MKNPRIIALCLLCLAGLAPAAAPVKAPLARYARLWTNSPFTVKPQVTTGPTGPEVNDFEDWALGGVTELNNGYFLVLLNKKKQGEKVIVEPGQASDWQVIDVRRDPLDPKKTEVVVQKGSKQGTLTYDEKLLAGAQKPPQGQQPRPPIPGQPVRPVVPGTQPPQPGQVVPATANPPRMRVVPPQTNQPQAAPSTGGRSSGGRGGYPRGR